MTDRSIINLMSENRRLALRIQRLESELVFWKAAALLTTVVIVGFLTLKFMEL